MVIGFACRVVDGHPIVVGVRVERLDGLIARQVINHRPVKHSSWPDKLRLVAGEVETLMLAEEPAAVLVKTMEARTPVGPPKLDDAARMRLHLEGVLLLTSQAHSPIVDVLTGQELGRLVGKDKKGIEEDAALLVGSKKELVEACAAGLGALVLAEGQAG